MTRARRLTAEEQQAIDAHPITKLSYAGMATRAGVREGRRVVSARHKPRLEHTPRPYPCPLDDDMHAAVRNAIVEAHAPLIEKLAYAAARRGGTSRPPGERRAKRWVTSRVATFAPKHPRWMDEYIQVAWEAALREFHHWDPEIAEFGTFIKPRISGALYALIGRDYCVARGGVSNRSWDAPIEFDADDPDAPRTLGDAFAPPPDDGSAYVPARGDGNRIEDAWIDRLDTKLHPGRLRRVIGGMPAGADRDILTWRLLAGLDHAEIAERLGVGVVTVRKRFSRALPRLQMGNGMSHGDGSRAIYILAAL